ncbi:MAG TPA: SDR family NAD(P)-dependent oxidoreductase [Acidimicrobiia bacterium]
MSAVIVTGAASGLGAAITERLIGSGFMVIGVDVDSDGLDQAGAAGGDSFVGFPCDVTDEATIGDVFDRIGALDHSVTGLVNSAGIGGEFGDVTKTTPDQWRLTLEVNLTGAFLVSRATVPLMRRSGGGSIVHVSSQLGMVGAVGSPAYSASKGGLIALGRSMAIDHAPDRIRVNVICPGPMDTPMFRSSSGPDNLDALVTNKIPWGRIGRPSEVAALVEFLMRGDAEFITGAVIPIDGGWTA